MNNEPFYFLKIITFIYLMRPLLYVVRTKVPKGDVYFYFFFILRAPADYLLGQLSCAHKITGAREIIWHTS